MAVILCVGAAGLDAGPLPAAKMSRPQGNRKAADAVLVIPMGPSLDDLIAVACYLRGKQLLLLGNVDQGMELVRQAYVLDPDLDPADISEANRVDLIVTLPSGLPAGLRLSVSP
jgi:hypothetical protein